MTEEQLHAHLMEYFCGLEQNEKMPALDHEGKFAFVIMAFCKPSDPTAFVRMGNRKYPVTRGDKEAAVGVALAQACPDIEIMDDGKTDSHAVIREGIHALCASVAAKYMTEIALNQIVGQSQMVLRKRAELTDD